VLGLAETAAALQKEASLPPRPTTPPPIHPTATQRPLSVVTPKQVINIGCI